MFSKIKKGFNAFRSVLQKTRERLGEKLHALLSGPIDEEALEKIEELLYQADLGVTFVNKTTDLIRKKMRQGRVEAEGLIAALQEELTTTLATYSSDLLPPPSEGPMVILVVGVNGNGKTTTIAKLAHRFSREGKQVLLGAGDTFRAAAIEQLQLWADRIGVELIHHQLGSDPSALIFDTLTAGRARNVDVILLDTAGRLHNKTDLMAELEKIGRVCNKVIPGSPHETLLILDATTGQNGIEQAKNFHRHTPLSGIVLTKLDGSAKGGIILPIQEKLGLPVKFVGTGEGVEDLEPFEAKSFVEALLA